MSLITLCFLFPLEATAKDTVKEKRGDIKIYRHGVETEILTTEHRELIKRVRSAFGKNTNDTSTLWYKNDFTSGGDTLEDQWDAIKSSSYISFTPLQKPIIRKSVLKNRTDMTEIIIEIMETPEKNLFGRTMAKYPDGEIRGYNIPDKWLVYIYCVDIANKYLPDHYDILTEKYSSPPYEELRLNCITQKNN